MKTLLVTGTDTDVGKTWVTFALLRQLGELDVALGAYKPVCSGAVIADDGQSQWHDLNQLSAAIGGHASLDAICPQRFHAAVAPNVAAALEGRHVDDSLLSAGLEAWRDNADYVIVEGAGGLLCPLSDTTSVADLAARLNSPILIVAANRLGVINHTLLTVDCAIARGLTVAGVVLNDCQSPTSLGDESLVSNAAQLAHWVKKVPVFQCRHGSQRIEAVADGPAFVLMDCFRSSEFHRMRSRQASGVHSDSPDAGESSDRDSP